MSRADSRSPLWLIAIAVLATLACGGSEPTRGGHVMKMVPIERLQSSVDRLRPGMEKAHVIKELGPPSAETELMGKQSRVPSGTELSYYVYRESPTVTNEKKDKWLSLYFDGSGGLVRVYSTIPDLKLDPRLLMRDPTSPAAEPATR